MRLPLVLLLLLLAAIPPYLCGLVPLPPLTTADPLDPTAYPMVPEDQTDQADGSTETSIDSVGRTDSTVSLAGFESSTVSRTVPSSPQPIDDDVFESPRVAPSPQVADDSHKSTSMGDGSNANKTAGLENLSASELKSRLDLAETTENSTKITFDKEEKNLENKKVEARNATQDYDKKKKDWEDLVKIAEGKSATWEKDKTDADTATKEYASAKKKLDTAGQEFGTATLALAAFPDKITAQKAVVKTFEDRPIKLKELRAKLQAKEDGKPGLITLVGELNLQESKNKTTFDRCDGAVTNNQNLINSNKCTITANALKEPCKKFLADMPGLKNQADQAKRDYDAAVKNAAGPQKELDDYDKDKRKIDKDIKDLERYESNFQTAIDGANSDLETLIDQEKDQVGEVEYWGNKTEAAKIDEQLKLGAKTTAEQKIAGGTPVEVTTAWRNAQVAETAKTTAEGKMKTLNDQVVEFTKKRDKAETAWNEAKSDVEALKKHYAEARRKEEESQKGMSPLVIVLPILAVLIVVGGIVGFFMYKRYKKKKCTLKGTEQPPSKKLKTGRKGSTSKTRTPSTGRGTSAADTEKLVKSSPAPGANVPSTSQVPPAAAAAAAGTTPALDSDAAYEALIDKKTGLIPAPSGPFIPGEQPFKIPAKHFKWTGPLRRRTRWHGNPDHELDGVEPPKGKLNISFDPNANTATQIGDCEIIEDGGPASDSNRSGKEWLTNLDQWERDHCPATLTCCPRQDETVATTANPTTPRDSPMKEPKKEVVKSQPIPDKRSASKKSSSSREKPKGARK